MTYSFFRARSGFQVSQDQEVLKAKMDYRVEKVKRGNREHQGHLANKEDEVRMESKGNLETMGKFC